MPSECREAGNTLAPADFWRQQCIGISIHYTGFALRYDIKVKFFNASHFRVVLYLSSLRRWWIYMYVMLIRSSGERNPAFRRTDTLFMLCGCVNPGKLMLSFQSIIILIAINVIFCIIACPTHSAFDCFWLYRVSCEVHLAIEPCLFAVDGLEFDRGRKFLLPIAR